MLLIRVTFFSFGAEDPIDFGSTNGFNIPFLELELELDSPIFDILLDEDIISSYDSILGRESLRCSFDSEIAVSSIEPSSAFLDSERKRGPLTPTNLFLLAAAIAFLSFEEW